METTFSVFRKMQQSPAVAVQGQVLTKPHIVQLMLDLAGERGDWSPRLLDPGCGEGAFISAALSRRLQTGGIPTEFEAVAGSLVGIEKDSPSATICRARLQSILIEAGTARPLAKRLARHWIVEGDFLAHSFPSAFDLVVGNPPYVRQEAIPKDKLAYYRAHFECFYDRADLYIAFFEKSLKLLSAGGKLAFICPNRFLRNNYGRKLRALITEQFNVEHVVDLAQASPFEREVSSYPGIFVIKQGAQRKYIDYFRLTHATPEECNLVREKKSNGVVTYHQYEDWFKGEQQWSIESPQHLALLRRLEHENVPLGNDASGCRVGIGVATGADDVFIVDQHSTEVEADLLMPLATTQDIASGAIDWHGECVINPFVGGSRELIDLSKYPRARRYFQEFQSRLQGRNVARRNPRQWFRTIDRIYPELQRMPKLLIPDIKAENLIVLEPGQLYPHHNLYYIASETWNLQALRTILRSSVGKFFVWMYGVKMRGDFLRFQAQYLRKICIPRPLFVEKSRTKALLAADASNNQHRIDEVVAELYALSDAELALIRSASARPMR